MKSILISIRPQWVAKILNGRKTIELRKTAPKCDLPIDVLIYCTKGMDLFKFSWQHTWYESFKSIKDICTDQLHALESDNLSGKVVGKFRLKKVIPVIMKKGPYNFELGYYCPTENGLVARWRDEKEKEAALSHDDLRRYLKGNNGYAWQISDLETFDEPKPLAALGAKSAPQSWVYIESDREPIYARNGRCEAYCDGKLIGGNYILHITMNGSEIMHQKWAVMPTKAQADEILAALNPEGI